MRPFGRQLAFAIALTTTLSGCGASGLSPMATGRAIAPVHRSAVDAAAEKALIKELGMLAMEAIANADAAYEALKLNTAAGRKITPQKEPLLRAGLKPVLDRFEADAATLRKRLDEAGPAKFAALARELDQRGPGLTDALSPDAGASDMIYRIAQYRLKFGFMVEYAHRKGVMPQTPTWKEKPSTEAVN